MRQHVTTVSPHKSVSQASMPDRKVSKKRITVAITSNSEGSVHHLYASLVRQSNLATSSENGQGPRTPVRQLDQRMDDYVRLLGGAKGSNEGMASEGRRVLLLD